ncbi:MAG TPA: ISNCY family transposase [Vicinamibacteria bacterium]|jgi:molybdenum-dependent DNA-binding transcriptional regulator ModE|nr:ISNCY family transposase [Vicinamibacteria bacterium]
MLFPPTAVERAMQIKDVLLRAMNKEFSWLQAAEILGITPRGLRRLRQRMERFGYQGLVDMRRGRPSPRRTPVTEIERVLALYRERHSGFNVRHFWQTVRREHGVTLSYTLVKQILQGAGLVKKAGVRGRHRRRRERKACFGEMLHLDGSTHRWLALCRDDKQTLIQLIDDATSQLLYAQLWPSESGEAVMTALREVIHTHGIPMSLYTDRASWAFETPRAGAKVDKAHLTQVGRALAKLGVEHIPSYSPQARGRSERVNGTLQGRVVNELRCAGIKTMEQANQYLRDRYLATHNEAFRRPPSDEESAFVATGDVDLDAIFVFEDVRTVAKDNTITFEGVVMQLAAQPGRRTCAGLHVIVRRHLDRSYAVWRGTQLFGRFDAQGQSIAVSSARSRRTARPRPMEAAGPVENRQRMRFPTRTLDVGKRRRRPQLPQGPPPANL